jgi:hypothetical protein
VGRGTEGRGSSASAPVATRREAWPGGRSFASVGVGDVWRWAGGRWVGGWVGRWPRGGCVLGVCVLGGGGGREGGCPPPTQPTNQPSTANREPTVGEETTDQDQRQRKLPHHPLHVLAVHREGVQGSRVSQGFRRVFQRQPTFSASPLSAPANSQVGHFGATLQGFRNTPQSPRVPHVCPTCAPVLTSGPGRGLNPGKERAHSPRRVTPVQFGPTREPKE